MIAVDRRDAWVGPSSWPEMITERALVGTAILIESEMALFSECMCSCAQIVLDTADIVRDACLRQLLQPFRVGQKKSCPGGLVAMASQGHPPQWVKRQLVP